MIYVKSLSFNPFYFHPKQYSNKLPKVTLLPFAGTQSQYEVNLDGLSFGAKIKSYLDDLVYLIFNKTFVFVTIGFTALCFTTGALAWWGNHLIIDAIVLRNETQTPGFHSDPSEEE